MRDYPQTDRGGVILKKIADPLNLFHSATEPSSASLQFLLFVGRENQALCDLATENCGHLPTGDALFSPEWKDEA